MRLLIVAVFLFLVVAPVSADHDSLHAPKDVIIRIAHLLAARHAPMLAEARFGATTVDAEAGQPVWTVMGLAYDPNLTGDAAEHVYVGEMRLVCDDATDEICWRLERLGVNFAPVYRAKKTQ